jgi:2,3,4,5-tetrahydropyridine-2-carboxylate N-succinyltransferase/tetrahydrodipicolinate N-acetyltransferase
MAYALTGDDDMDAQEIIRYISESEKKTPVRIFIKEKPGVCVDYGTAKVFGAGDKIVFGDWKDLKPILDANAEFIEDLVVENDRRNSGVPMLDLREIPARIEPGAVIREKVEIGANAVIMMGAIINIGAVIGEGTMIDMGAVLGGRATVGKHCHIGAGAVLAGVIEPASAVPVIVEDNVLVGANAVVIEGVHVGEGAVVAAGAIVTEDVPANAVVAGCPARVIKMKDDKTTMKTALEDALRKL